MKPTPEKKILFVTALLCVCSILLAVLTSYSSKHTTVVFNEVCSNNFSIIKTSTDPEKYSDYIELYNASSVSVSLDKWTFTTKGDKSSGFTFPEITLEPGAYLLLLRDDNADALLYHSLNTTVAAGDSLTLSVPFSLSKNGDTLYLKNSVSKTVDHVSIPSADYNLTYSRVDDGSFTWQTASGTPGYTNAAARKLLSVSKKIASPVFSADSGLYKNAFDLSITCEKDCEIYYTTDGSMPTTDSTRYTGPISLSSETISEESYAARPDLTVNHAVLADSSVPHAIIVRAIAVNKNLKRSVSTTATYFFGAATDYPAIPVLSIVADPDDFFGDHGIYTLGKTYDAYVASGGFPNSITADANYTQSGKEWERTAALLYSDSVDAPFVFSETAGVRIASRHNWLAQKDFMLYHRDIYSDDPGFAFPAFYADSTPSKLYLRFAKEREYFISSLLAAAGYPCFPVQPVSLFLNGEYWGAYYLEEAVSSEYISNAFGITPNGLTILKSGERITGSGMSALEYNNLLSFASSSDLSDDDNYQKLTANLDLSSYETYYAYQLFLGNSDYAPYKNCVVWRNGDEDSWHILANSFDSTLEQYMLDQGVTTNSVDYLMQHDAFFSSLMENASFRKDFSQAVRSVCRKLSDADTLEAVISECSDALDADTLEDFSAYLENRSYYLLHYLDELIASY